MIVDCIAYNEDDTWNETEISVDFKVYPCCTLHAFHQLDKTFFDEYLDGLPEDWNSKTYTEVNRFDPLNQDDAKGKGKGKAQISRTKGKGKRRTTQQENALDPTWQRNAARACVRTKRNDSPVGSPPQPPMSP